MIPGDLVVSRCVADVYADEGLCSGESPLFELGRDVLGIVVAIHDGGPAADWFTVFAGDVCGTTWSADWKRLTT